MLRYLDRTTLAKNNYKIAVNGSFINDITQRGGLDFGLFVTQVHRNMTGRRRVRKSPNLCEVIYECLQSVFWLVLSIGV